MSSPHRVAAAALTASVACGGWSLNWNYEAAIVNAKAAAPARMVAGRWNSSPTTTPEATAATTTTSPVRVPARIDPRRWNVSPTTTAPPATTTTRAPSRPSYCGRGPLESVGQVSTCWRALIATCREWPVDEMVRIVYRESRGWHLANNPSSSAFGLYQQLRQTSRDPGEQTRDACALARQARQYWGDPLRPWQQTRG